TDTNLIYWRGMRDKQYMNIDTSIDSAAAGESGHFYLGGGMSKFVIPPGWGIKTVEAFDLRTGSTVIKDTRNMIYGMEIDAEGPRLALALQQPSRVRALAVSRSKQLLASGSEDGKVRLFKLSDLSPVAVLEDGVGDITDVGFLAGGDQLLSYGLD